MLPPPVRRRADALVLPTPPPLLRHSRFFPSFRLFFLSFQHFFLSFRLFSVIPAKAGIPRKYSAERAHCSAWRNAPPLKGARSARFIRWIPAPVQARGKLCAGMARWGHGNGGVGFIRWMPIGFLHSLESRNPAQKERGTRTFSRGE